jgi:hypothetical protein
MLRSSRSRAFVIDREDRECFYRSIRSDVPGCAPPASFRLSHDQERRAVRAALRSTAPTESTHVIRLTNGLGFTFEDNSRNLR